ncbi:hypothetical protein HDV00_004837 [Rhizophlyctis rosea]|nr:hypothetical protein HDV00_004837 [Rhizophlyctis rosea]
MDVHDVMSSAKKDIIKALGGTYRNVFMENVVAKRGTMEVLRAQVERVGVFVDVEARRCEAVMGVGAVEGCLFNNPGMSAMDTGDLDTEQARAWQDTVREEFHKRRRAMESYGIRTTAISVSARKPDLARI